MLEDQLGKEKTASILASLNKAPKQSVRANIAKISQADLLQDLEKDGFDAEPSKVSSEGIIIKDGQIIHSSFFSDGLLTIQDESAMLPVESMNISPSDNILDACSAPGGKTTQIASRLDGGKVFALDIHKNKLKTVQRNATRLGLYKKVETFELDARKVDSKFEDGMFDSILVDAPCSGLGLLRRKPEIRYDKTIATLTG